MAPRKTPKHRVDEIVEPSNSVKIYQLRVSLTHISPMIWRRVLVRSDNTLADLHYRLSESLLESCEARMASLSKNSI